MPFRFARNVRTLQRLRTIAQVLSKHGFGHLVENLDLGRFVPLWMKPKSRRNADAQETHTIGQRLAAVCTELGPTYVKLGQMMSTRPDILPAHIITDLQKLQSQVEPFSSEQAGRIVEEDLGAPAGETFGSFEPDPFASGSIAQVHHAVTKDGQKVVVKVRRPGIETVIRNDMYLLTNLAEAIERYVPDLKPYHPVMIVEEFHRTITRELDFINEASATARFGTMFKGDKSVRIPEVRWDLTGTQVLTLEHLDGRTVAEVLAGEAPEVDRKQVAENLANVFLKQFFETGLVHADPHPGNLLISPPATVGLIDFGMVGQVSDEMMTQLMVALLAAVNRQVDLVVDVLAEVGGIGAAADMNDLTRDIQMLLDKYYGLPLKRLDLPTLFTELSDVVRRHDISLPREFVMLAKSLAMTAGTVLQLDPDLNLLELIRPRLKQLVMRRFSMQQVTKTLGISLWHVLNIVKNAPAQVRSAIRQFARGQWEVKIHHLNLDRLTRELDRSSNRVAFALVISSMIIGSSMMLAAGTAVQVFGIELRWFGVVGYVVAGVMGLGLVWAIFRSGRLY